MSTAIAEPTSIGTVPVDKVGGAHCVECGSSRTQDWGPCRKFDRGATPEEIELMTTHDAGRLHWCEDCGLAYRFPILNREEIERVYASYETADWDYPVFEGRAAWK